jgi:hypothetical protein
MRIAGKMAYLTGALLFVAAPCVLYAGDGSGGQAAPLVACVLPADGSACPAEPARKGSQDAQAATAEPHRGIARVVHAWIAMAESVGEQQPNWLSPVATTSGRLKQEFRYDSWRQAGPAGSSIYNFGGGKGLEFVVAPRVQLMVGVPPYTLPTQAGTKNGFGDLPLMLKARLFSRPPGEGDSLLTFILGATVPVGGPLYGNGKPVLSPALAFGKGKGKWDVQGTIGGSFPVGGDAKLGNQLVSNTALQFHAVRLLWPECEVNATFYESGKYAGKNQVFLTPGLGFGRVRLRGRLSLSLGAGVQIAATRFHTYNHRAIVSLRLPF